jgi:hypothetical protein
MAKNKKRPDDSGFVFRRVDNIGAADAHDDVELLLECFVDTGELDALKDMSLPKRMVVGRTGSGKTALLEKLASDNRNHTITIQAEELALDYVANSGVLRALQDVGVKLDPFFRLLWRHVIAVAVLRKRFGLQSGEERSKWSRLFDRFRNTSHQKALEYIETWGGDQFWEETETRVKEITSKFEKEIEKDWTGAVNIRAFGGKVGKHSAERLSEEQRSEIVSHGQKVVNEVHLKELGKVIEWIRDVLEEAHDYYYVIIDRLDENWVSDDIRYQLIRALIETAKDFQKAPNCKVIVAARDDLLARVYQRTADPGFQEEKYKSTYLTLRWTKAQLTELVEKRLNSLLRRRYTKRPLSIADVFPSKIEGQTPMEFILERTLLRPRDAISFVNLSIENADGSNKISVSALKRAEQAYSEGRISALRDEWAGDYPDLKVTWPLLRGVTRVTSLELLPLERFEAVGLEHAARPKVDSPIFASATDMVEGRATVVDFRNEIVTAWHRIGIVGLKMGTTEHVLWAYRGDRVVSPAELTDAVRIHVHRLAVLALGVIDSQ